jgi:hypothetical protein
MLVELETLKDNPMRDFIIDPMDSTLVETLKHSIEEHGFWGGVVCRQVEDGTIEIAAGHHRIAAAMQAGITQADLFVRTDPVDNGEMVLLYATENSTQRGNTSTALAGTVASAVSYLTKGIITGTVATEKFFSCFDPEQTRRQLEADRGIGREVIVEFLKKVPGINNGTVQQQLANLKASGDYARLIAAVEDEIAAEEAEALAQARAAEEEHQRRLHEQEVAEQARREAEEAQRRAEEEQRAARARARAAREAETKARRDAEAQAAEVERQRAEALERLAEQRRQEADEKRQVFEVQAQAARDAEARRQAAAAKQAEAEAIQHRKAQERASAKKAVRKAEEKAKTFDLEGVAQYFKNPYQLDVFRKIVTTEEMLAIHPVERQVELAKFIVDQARERGAELTGRYIRESIRDLLTMGKAEGRKTTQKEVAELLLRDMRYKEEQYQLDMIRGLALVSEAGRKLEALYAEAWPTGEQKHLRPHLHEHLTNAKVMIERALALL